MLARGGLHRGRLLHEGSLETLRRRSGSGYEITVAPPCDDASRANVLLRVGASGDANELAAYLQWSADAAGAAKLQIRSRGTSSPSIKTVNRCIDAMRDLGLDIAEVRGVHRSLEDQFLALLRSADASMSSPSDADRGSA